MNALDINPVNPSHLQQPKNFYKKIKKTKHSNPKFPSPDKNIYSNSQEKLILSKSFEENILIPSSLKKSFECHLKLQKEENLEPILSPEIRNLVYSLKTPKEKKGCEGKLEKMRSLNSFQHNFIENFLRDRFNSTLNMSYFSEYIYFEKVLELLKINFQEFFNSLSRNPIEVKIKCLENFNSKLGFDYFSSFPTQMSQINQMIMEESVDMREKITGKNKIKVEFQQKKEYFFKN